ncbi:MAG: ABC transporter ATP-binding protein [Myxococcales bacterium]|nr:ABC transporter ATP-binding protein [Myxococcales bacterium]MCB9672483.1 ABC transporter ATP-binding protein [Alphaproteobacteria bacterium]MCB9691734.1 ABC transporter ATP-binding protein [Alphaproteobacteria bacterium]
MAIVSVRDLHREYQQGNLTVRALNGVSLDIEPGEFTVLMGSSGSGKTTLLNCMGALDHPTSGTVTVDGTDLASLSEGQLSDLRLTKLGFVFQAYNLVPVLTAYENAEFVLLLQGVPSAQRRERVLQTLDAVGLKELATRRPAELSGGQQQRVAVARAIAGKPALVLADEPTANLDSKTGHALIDLMRGLNEDHGITFVFATHDPKVMDAAKRIVKMEDGKILEDVRR